MCLYFNCDEQDFISQKQIQLSYTLSCWSNAIVFVALTKQSNNRDTTHRFQFHMESPCNSNTQPGFRITSLFVHLANL